MFFLEAVVWIITYADLGEQKFSVTLSGNCPELASGVEGLNGVCDVL